VLDVMQTIEQPKFQVGGHDEGYSMRGTKKIWSEKRSLHPGCGGEEGGDRKQQRETEKTAAQKTEECTEKTVRDAKADGRSRAAQELAEQCSDDHRGDEDEDEGSELGELRRGDEAGEVRRCAAIEPAGEEEAEDKAAEREDRGLRSRPAGERGASRVGSCD
jgi:hypothetical protein